MILIDKRLGSRDLIDLPPLDTLSSLTVLDSADVCFSGNGPGNVPHLIGIEVKSIEDMISSLQSGRLQAEQIPKMLETYDERWIAFYGQYREGEKGALQLRHRKNNSWVNYSYGNGRSPLPYTYLDRFLCSPSFTGLGIHVKHFPDKGALARWIGEVLYPCWSKRWEDHKSMRVFNKTPNSWSANLRMAGNEVEMGIALTAGTFPGIRYERGEKCAEHFRSIYEMVNADEEEWEKIPGIGKVLAKSVVQSIRREKPKKVKAKHPQPTPRQKERR